MDSNRYKLLLYTLLPYFSHWFFFQSAAVALMRTLTFPAYTIAMQCD